MSGRVKGAWAYPDPATWSEAFQSVPYGTGTPAQADCAVHVYGDGWSYEIVANEHGVSKQAVASHVQRFHRNVHDLLEGRRPGVVTQTICRPPRMSPEREELRAAALAYIREFNAIARLMAEPPVPPVWRTHGGRLRGRLRPGIAPLAFLDAHSTEAERPFHGKPNSDSAPSRTPRSEATRLLS